jgi:hypothetical protein
MYFTFLSFFVFFFSKKVALTVLGRVVPRACAAALSLECSKMVFHLHV